MIAEAPGPLEFQMLLQLFGEKMSGTDPEVAQMFDQVKPAGGKFNYGKFTRIMKRGSDRLTEAEVAQMFDQVKPAG